MVTDSDNRWRETAHLREKNWPEAIHAIGPKTKHGVSEWGKPHTEHDNYPRSHPAAASVGGSYMGDVCPECGVPLRFDETVVNANQVRGNLLDVSPNENQVACWHPECWRERHKRVAQENNHTLEGFK